MPAPYSAFENKAEHPLSGLKEEANVQFGKMADKATQKLTDAADQATQFASRAVEDAKVVGEVMREVASNIQPVVHKSMRDQPMATLAVAAGVGFVLGVLWKS